jgi:hypothetical protein
VAYLEFILNRRAARVPFFEASATLRWVELVVVFTHPLCHVEASGAPATASQLAGTLATLPARAGDAAGRGAVTSAS